MGTGPCPSGDGYCSYPDRALVMVKGTFSVVTGDTAERMFPVDDSAEDAPLEIPESSSYDDLVDLVLDARRAESPGLSAYEDTDELRSQLATVEEAFAAGSDDDWVIVYCSPCGHMWRKRVQR